GKGGQAMAESVVRVVRAFALTWVSAGRSVYGRGPSPPWVMTDGDHAAGMCGEPVPEGRQRCARTARSPARAESDSTPWEKRVKCRETDPDGRAIPARYGNHLLGWRHFSGKHNIRTCKIVDAALSGNVDKREDARLEYWAYAVHPGAKRVKIIVVVQYSRKTKDGEYDAGRGQKIGVITAYCKGMNKCPNWMNSA
ncbi:hypothetical protein, partial [Streptomyces clavuligerus]|uniref:hypothetical protein n=2 Tax=Streptomyces clavuligerus TaxID=1901 RepID=UPI001E2B739B